MQTRRGETAFEDFYRQIFGERWTKLSAVLRQPATKVALLNPFAKSTEAMELPTFCPDLPVRVLDLRDSAVAGQIARLPRVEPEAQLNIFYELDLASVLAASALPVAPGEKWLDLCAAPGGKALAILFATRAEGEATLNELSPERFKRLKAVIHDYLPMSAMGRVNFFRRDGSRWGMHEPAAYDAVVVDAPCSGERHLLASAKELKLWSARRSEGLAIRQFALLCSALDAVRPGGHILYSTCSLSPKENDLVVERLLERRQGRVKSVEPSVWLGDRTRQGVQIAPDLTGWGPIYYSILQRLD